MNQFYEAALIALSSIWANKLRSFLTVLGNIVAVTSIIAVVSLIQGMNAYVSDAIISDVGADNFTIQRMPVVRSVEDEERVRNNPRITLADADAVRRFSDNIHAVAAQASANGRIAWGEESLDRVSIQGVSRDYLYFSTFDAERGRLISQSEIDRNRPVTVLGWEVADKLFGGRDPLDRVVMIRGVHFRVVGVSEKKGSVFGQSQDEFAIVPLGAFYKLFGSRFGLQLLVKPKTPDLVQPAMDDVVIEFRVGKNLAVGLEGHFGARRRRHPQFLQLADDFPAGQFHRPDMPFAADFDLHPFGQGVHRLDADAVQPACSPLVSPFAIELAADQHVGGVGGLRDQHRRDQRDRDQCEQQAGCSRPRPEGASAFRRHFVADRQIVASTGAEWTIEGGRSARSLRARRIRS